MSVDHSVAPFFEIGLTLRERLMCELCARIPSYQSQHTRFSDEDIYTRAAEMQRHGWHIVGPLEVVCPRCVANLQAVA